MFRGKGIFNASFDVDADNYHSVRPGYPAQLFKDIKDQCGIDKKSRLLEIGAGSGIATVALAKFGCQVVAIEPGANLAKIARKHTKKFNRVKIVEGTFEDFQSAEKFDAVLAFTAFHWISEAVKYQKANKLLKNSGSLVVAWNGFFQSNTPVTAKINKVYKKFLSDLYPKELKVVDVNEEVFSKLNRREHEIISNPLFYSVFLRKYLTTYNYDSWTYPKLLNAFPKIVEVDNVRRRKFLSRVSSIVKRHGKISVPILTTLIISKKKEYFLKMISGG